MYPSGLYFKQFRLTALFLFFFMNAAPQESKTAFSGYLKSLSMYYHPELQLSGMDNLSMTMLHNRLNFSWYATEKLSFGIEGRNRLILGRMVKDFPSYKSYIDTDNGYFDLSAILVSDKSWFLHSAIDRAWIDYTSGKWNLRIGRQRINWGINFVWNPNDIFNTFSYFDFDYEERPGADAVKIQYYTGATSSAEVVYKPGRKPGQTALAGLYRFSEWDYDFQFLGGCAGDDYILGGGWAGDIKGGGFRGEVSYFLPREKNNGSGEALVASVSGDYTLKNSLYLHGGFLFNSHGEKGKAGGRSVFDTSLSAKVLSLARYSVFGQASYPFTPLFSGSLSGMYNPLDHSFYFGPSFTCSLGNNLELLLAGQLFFGENGTEFGDYGQIIFGRLKWAF